MTRYTPTFNEMTPSLHGPIAEDHDVSDHSTGSETTPRIGQLVNPTWAEVEGALERYDQDAKRLRYWQWWFIGMFTFYTTLVGILLLKLITVQ